MNNAKLKSANILIVDDRQANIDLLTGFLDDEGYANYTSTTDSREVIGLFEEFKPDLILLDLHMPHLSGFQVMEQLKGLLPLDDYLPILVLTADATTETKLKALAAGAKDFLSKPFDLTEVELRIKNLLLTRSMYTQLKNQNLILEEKVEERTLELKNSIVELIAAKEKAEESDNLKTAFINNISHEIRTPLNGILGFGQFLASPELTSAEREEYYLLVEQSSNRLMSTVTDYMDMALIYSGTMDINRKDFLFRPFFEKLTGTYRPHCETKGIALTIELPEGSADYELHTDYEFIRKTFTVIFENAIKFTEKGSIGCGYRIIPGFVEVYVTDTGKGIDADKLGLIFEMFAQEDVSNTRGHEGSGLGLTIAKGLVQLLGGTIAAKSEKGKGTTFSFTIPLDREEAIEAHESKPKVTRKAKDNAILLVAEDDESNYLYLKTVIDTLGCRYIHAVNGAEAVEKCQQNPEIDLILMDIKMPVMNGIEATKQIRKFKPNIPIIATTAYAQTGDEHRFIEAGCNDYLAKPLRLVQLNDIIQKYTTYPSSD